ncbi:MAG: Zn-ribbon domain-containing OB-fold protein [Chloroflexota bacterium]
MADESNSQELINIPFTVDVPYRFAAGQYLSRFLLELRDNGRFFGIKCPQCGRVQMPPRVVCAVCHVKNDEWVELGHEGTLLGFSIVHLPLTDPTTGQPHKTPYTYGSVRLDGCDSVIDHLIDPSPGSGQRVEPDVDQVRVGMRLGAVLRPRAERTGDLSDIVHFAPVEGQPPGTDRPATTTPIDPSTNPPAFEVDQHITAPSRYYAGRVGSKFFTTLRDEQRILGSRCATCNQVYWPPRSTCGRCFGQLGEDDLVEIGPHGTLETFTLVTYQEAVHPRPAPLIYGIVRLDGADTGMAHLIAGVEFERLAVGMRLQPVFAPEREANMLAISHFKPL